MRVFSRFALVLLVVVSSAPLIADTFRADCPMTQVSANPPATDFSLSPHGVFRSGSLVYALRGQTLSTYTVTDLGDLQIAREDFIGEMAARDTAGGVAFSNGMLYVSSEAGLEVFNLSGVTAGGVAPQFIARLANLHYRRLAASGNLLAALYPATDLPCFANGSTCINAIDIYDVSSPGSPSRVSSILSSGPPVGWNDIAFNNGKLIATGYGETVSYDLSNKFNPQAKATAQAGTFLVSNGTNLVGVGNDTSVLVYTFDSSAFFHPYLYESVSPLFSIDRQNPVVFHPQGTFDEAGGRLIMMVDERDPLTLGPARTVGFDVFDFPVPQYEGSAPRIYETISETTTDEVKWNPLAVGPYVYAIGELSGLQTWGACGMMAGKIELLSVAQLSCGGAEIHGWVTGALKIVNVELFLDQGSLGTVTVGGVPRNDIASPTPVMTWRAAVNLDATTRGDHVLRLVATDAIGNRRQIYSQRVFFPGPGQNCTARRRTGSIVHF